MRPLTDKGAAAPITKATGLTLDDPISKFWPHFSTDMNSPKKKATMVLSDALTNDHGVTSAGCLFQMYAHEFEQVVVQSGGAVGWTRSVEYLWGQEFERLTSNVPESADLVATERTFSKPLQQAKSKLVTKKRTRYEQDENDESSNNRLTAVLKETGKFEQVLSLDKAVIDKLVVETMKPVRSRLTYRDTSRVTDHCFRRSIREGHVACEKEIFDFWEEQLITFGYTLPFKKTWPHAFRNRFKNGRKANAQVHRACTATCTIITRVTCPLHCALVRRLSTKNSLSTRMTARRISKSCRHSDCMLQCLPKQCQSTCKATKTVATRLAR